MSGQLAWKRMLRDINEIMSQAAEMEKLYGITIEENPNPKRFLVTIRGPDDTPYSGGTYELEVTCPTQYPHQPLKIRFVTRVWHPNISSETGIICVDILNSRWRSIMTLRTCLISLRCLMAQPEPDNPQEWRAGEQMICNKTMFEETATMWTYIHASGPRCIPSMFAKIRSLDAIGAGTSDAIRLKALSDSDWDVDIVATRYLIRDNPLDDLEELPALILL